MSTSHNCSEFFHIIMMIFFYSLHILFYFFATKKLKHVICVRLLGNAKRDLFNIIKLFLLGSLEKNFYFIYSFPTAISFCAFELNHKLDGHDELATTSGWPKVEVKVHTRQTQNFTLLRDLINCCWVSGGFWKKKKITKTIENRWETLSERDMLEFVRSFFLLLLYSRKGAQIDRHEKNAHSIKRKKRTSWS
jgi:hypothetical protein